MMQYLMTHFNEYIYIAHMVSQGIWQVILFRCHRILFLGLMLKYFKICRNEERTEK